MQQTTSMNSMDHPDGPAWHRANRLLKLELPENNFEEWMTFCVRLWSQVEDWEDLMKRSFRPKSLDFCVIHTRHEDDMNVIRNFVRLLEAEGYYGRTLGDIVAGENTLDAAETMMNNSTKVFVLCTAHLRAEGPHKIAYQDALMRRCYGLEWRSRVIPLYVSGVGADSHIYGLGPIQGIVLRNDVSTVQTVNRTISLEDQMLKRRNRQREEDTLRRTIKREKERAASEIRNVIKSLYEHLGDDGDPMDFLDRERESLILDLPPGLETSQSNNGERQVVNITQSSAISVGPSFHFSLGGRETFD